MSSKSRPDETGTSVPARRRMAEGRDLLVVGSRRERQGTITRGNWTGKGRDGKMNSSNKVLDRCLWRRSTNHLRVPSKADALFSYSIGRQFKAAATAAKVLRDAERSSASVSSPKKPSGLAAKAEFVTSIANDVMRMNDDVGLTSSLTPNPHCGKVFERTTRRQTEESSGRGGIVGRKEGGLEPRERKKWGTIDREKGETVDRGKRRDEQRQIPFSEAEDCQYNKEKSNINNKEQSEQGNETGEKREERQKEEEKEEEEKKEHKEEESRSSEVSSSAMEFLDAVNDLAPEDKISGPIIGEEQVGANRNINQPEPSGTVTTEQLVPRPLTTDAADLQKPLSEAVPQDWSQKNAEEESDIATGCHEEQLQYVTLTIGSQTRCVHKIFESVQAQDGEERLPEDTRETGTETEHKIENACTTYRMQSTLDSLASQRHLPQSTVRSAEPQLSPSNSSHSYNTSKVTNEQMDPRHDVRVREVIIGDSKIRMISKRSHPQPNRASILRQVAAVSSSSHSSFAFSSASRSAIASPATLHRNSTVARNCRPTTPLVLIQGPFAKEYRKQSSYSKKKPTCLVGNSSRRANNNSPDSIKTLVKASRAKYQTTRTFLVNDSSNSPDDSPRRRSASSTQSPPKWNRTTPAAAESSAAGKRIQKELRPKVGLQQRQRSPRSIFIHDFYSREIKSGDDSHYHQNQPHLQHGKSLSVHRTVTRTLVAHAQQRWLVQL